MDLDYIRNRIHEVMMGKIAMGCGGDFYDNYGNGYGSGGGGYGSTFYDAEMQQRRYGSGVHTRKRTKTKKSCGKSCKGIAMEGFKDPGVMVGGKMYDAKVGRMAAVLKPRAMLGPLSSVIVGGRTKKRKPQRGVKSDWIAHVKKYAKDHGVTYKEAMSKARASYR